MTMQPVYTDTGQTPSDGMTTLRQFVGGLNAALNDQSYGYTDGVAYNPTGQFATVGPTSTAVEGQPLILSRDGGIALSPRVVMLALGAGIAWLLLRKG